MKTQIYYMIRLINMIQFIKLWFALILSFFLFNQILKAQDLRDFEHTQKFANYLFISRQFPLAAEEYERLVYLDSTDGNSKLRLIQSYRLAEKNKVALQCFERFFGDSLSFMKKSFAEEYIKNLILLKDNKKTIDFLRTNPYLDENTRQNYTLASMLLEKDWDNAFNFALKNSVTTDKKNADLHVMAFQSKQLKYKKPFVAALLSGIIPGTGKFYSKYWKDGLISMMLVGVNSWQSYRGFKKYGKESVYGWVFAGLGASFYVGGIYGAQKSAKKYNTKLDDEIYNKAWHVVVDDF